MTRILITAYEPYDEYEQNASWLALVELTRELPAGPEVTTRRYPVDFGEVRRRLAADLADGYDFALHLGQAPGRGRILLEAVGLNVGLGAGEQRGANLPLEEDGPLAYRSELPLDDWAAKLCGAGIPARVSYHAGTYLCNAALYWSHYYAERLALPTQSTFLHLPLDPAQTLTMTGDVPSLSATTSAEAIRLLMGEMAESSTRERGF